MNEKVNEKNKLLYSFPIRLKAGKPLESKGILPEGFTEMQYFEEGYKIPYLRKDLQDKDIDNKLEYRFKLTVENCNYHELFQLKILVFQPTKKNDTEDFWTFHRCP